MRLASLAIRPTSAYGDFMITVVIESDGNAEALARTVAALVPGVVAGLVGGCVILNPLGDPDTTRIADAAGADCLDTASVADAVAAAPGEWLLVLEPGARPRGDWIDALRTHIAAGSGAPARFADGRRPKHPFAALFRRPRPLATGLLIARAQALTIARNAPALPALARGRALVRLDAELIPAAR